MRRAHCTDARLVSRNTTNSSLWRLGNNGSRPALPRLACCVDARKRAEAKVASRWVGSMDVDRHIPLAEPLIDCKEAAVILGFSPIMVRRLAHDGQLPSIAFSFGKKGKFRYKFRVSELQAYLKSRSRSPRGTGERQQRLFS